LPKATIRALNAPLYLDENYPDWLVSCDCSLDDKRYIGAFFSRIHDENGSQVAYEYKLADILNVYNADPSRPELHLHSFGPVTKFDPATQGVAIYHKTNKIIFQGNFR
jgi:hypothetical protein